MEVITPLLPLEPAAAPPLDVDDAPELLPDEDEAVALEPLVTADDPLLEPTDPPVLPDPVDDPEVLGDAPELPDDALLDVLALLEDAPLDEPELLDETTRTRSPSGGTGSRAGTAWRRASGSQSMRGILHLRGRLVRPG